ncbi:unnamed protein product [Rotaria sordida]|uniref:Uncharacterized protein n=1 Tax=Rotaria sordida TaxID=392033 RepID=A0A814XM07_9BILA|nr:unnamed protein product [Rotaria sordida]
MSKKRVLIVGAGCAGMSCANQLAQHTEKFDVTLIDSIDRCVEQAFSIPVDKEKYGTGEHTLETVEEFEELVLCVLPDQAKILLGKTARWIDKFVLC